MFPEIAKARVAACGGWSFSVVRVCGNPWLIAVICSVQMFGDLS